VAPAGDEKEALRSQAELLSRNLEEIQRRIAELEKDGKV
jgi:prefoldin subunit 5